MGSISGITAVIPMAGSKRAKRGNVGRSISSAPILKCSLICITWASKLPCVYTAPFAGPVLPVVKSIAAVSSLLVIARGYDSISPVFIISRVYPPQNKRRPTVIHTLTVLKKPGNNVLSTWASGIPINASGLVDLRQESILIIPIPGSTTTGTAPILKRAKTREKKSAPGFTIRTVLVP